MELTGVQSVLAGGLVFLGGVCLQMCVEQLLTWRRSGGERAALWLGITAGTLSAVMVTSSVVPRLEGRGELLELVVGVRTAAFSALMVSVFPLAAALGRRRVPPLLLAVASVLAGLRAVLGFTTDLLHLERGGERVVEYGALLGWLNLPLLAAVVGYHAYIVWRTPSTREQALVSAGVVGTLSLAVVSLFVVAWADIELLTGYLMVPFLLAMYAVVLGRMARWRQAQRLLRARQSALVDLSADALTAPVEELRSSATAIVRRLLPAPRCEVWVEGGTPAAVEVAAPSAPEVLELEVVEREVHCRLRACRAEPFDVNDREFAESVLHTVCARAARARTEERIRHQALHDHLTGLPNRILLRDRVEHALRHGDRQDGHVVVALLDLDGFKEINDRYGHPVGDRVLVEVADRLEAAVRSGDTVCRFGGDEFGLVVEGVDERGFLEVAERVLAAVRRPFDLDDIATRLSTSLGATMGGADDDVDALLRDADLALYTAKARGGDAVELYDPELRSSLLRRLELERALEAAAERGEIVIHYQPIVSLGNGEVVRLEALARWQHGGGLLPPDEWVHVAERTGAIRSIGADVVRRAAADVRRWTGLAPDLAVSVNLAPTQLETDEILEVFGGLPADDARRVSVEVTESAVVEEGPALDMLHALRRLGVGVAIDDFGVGHSSLATLGRLPIDVIKIDRMITARIAERGGQALVAAVLAMGRALDMDVVAEGVETEAQRRALLDAGCRLAQGFLFSRPVPADEVERLLVARSHA